MFLVSDVGNRRLLILIYDMGPETNDGSGSIFTRLFSSLISGSVSGIICLTASKAFRNTELGGNQQKWELKKYRNSLEEM